MAKTLRCEHGLVICARCVVVTDAAKRMCDIINARIVFTPVDELSRGWMAFRLSDGGSDGALYDSRRAAISHQTNEFLCAYFSFRSCLGGANAKDCQLFLDMHRHVYDNGGRLADPEAPDLMMPLARPIYNGIGMLDIGRDPRGLPC